MVNKTQQQQISSGVQIKVFMIVFLDKPTLSIMAGSKCIQQQQQIGIEQKIIWLH